MFLLAGEYSQFAVEHEEGLVVPVVDVDGAGVAALGEVVGQGEGPAGLRAAGRQDLRSRCRSRAQWGRSWRAPSRAGGRIPNT
jgi:hypothetical protein